MAQARRSTDRRRRVLYQTHSATAAPSTPASRRAAEQLRAARQPAKAFGSRVGQPLRGRWFSLVPSSPLAMTAVAVVLCAIPISFALLHHLSFSWPALAYEQAVARPLQINRTDSFASWWTTLVLLLSAGVSTLIFQLRRHRSDDFRGHYRLWRMALIVSLAASLHHTVDLVGWLGAVMDLGLGDRAVLSGSKWLRIVMDVGGIIIAMQLIVELVRCRAALAAMVVTCGLFALLELAFWNVIQIQTNAMATLIIAAPMLGFSSFLLASTFYLRALYRQVVNVADEVSLRHRFSMWLATWRDQDIDVSLPEMEPAAARNGAVARVARPDAPSKPAASSATASSATASRTAASQPPAAKPQAKTQPSKPAAATKATSPLAARRSAEANADPTESTEQDDDATTPKRSLWSRLTKRAGKQDDDAENIDDTETSASAQTGNATDGPDETDDSAESKPKRRWFGLRAGKVQADEEPSDDIQKNAIEERSTEAEETATKPAKKPWFSLRLQPKTNEGAEDQEDTPSADTETDEDGEKKPGLFARLFSKKTTDDEEIDFQDEEAPENAEPSKPAAARKPGPLSRKSSPQPSQKAAGQSGQHTAQKPQPQQPVSTDGEIDPDDIDWESLSKSERRRLRKQIKRSGKAA